MNGTRMRKVTQKKTPDRAEDCVNEMEFRRRLSLTFVGCIARRWA
jgi:hypothetical protein